MPVYFEARGMILSDCGNATKRPENPPNVESMEPDNISQEQSALQQDAQ